MKPELTASSIDKLLDYKNFGKYSSSLWPVIDVEVNDNVLDIKNIFLPPEQQMASKALFPHFTGNSLGYLNYNGSEVTLFLGVNGQMYNVVIPYNILELDKN